MLVVAVVFLIIGGVSTAVQLAASLSDNYPDDDDDDDDYDTIWILCSAVSISLSKLDSSPPLILVYLHQKGESQVL